MITYFLRGVGGWVNGWMGGWVEEMDDDGGWIFVLLCWGRGHGLVRYISYTHAGF